ncbi:MAG: glycosyltransferase [Isosphaeraceae bacterium]|nr:glycosyltransferase [Isosphaeraceae bacterium]
MSDPSTRRELVGAADASSSSQPPDTIAVIIPTALQKRPDGRPLVAACLESLVPAAESPEERASDGGPRVREIVLVTQGRPFEGPVVARLASAGVYVRQFDVLGPFNFSTKINAGVAVASADTILLLNDDAVILGAEWPSVFLGILADPTVGAVGPVIINPDESLNAAGDTHSADGVRHVDGFDARYRPGLAEILARDHDVSLLTGAALVISASAFRSVGAFDEAYPSALGDTDFCLRLRAAGRRLVCSPRATVVHAEASTRDPKIPAATVRLFRRRHPEASQEDPLLPPLVLPRRIRIARAIVRPLRGAYRATIKRLVPRSLHLRLWHGAVSRGWVR